MKNYLKSYSPLLFLFTILFHFFVIFLSGFPFPFNITISLSLLIFYSFMLYTIMAPKFSKESLSFILSTSANKSSIIKDTTKHIVRILGIFDICLFLGFLQSYDNGHFLISLFLYLVIVLTVCATSTILLVRTLVSSSNTSPTDVLVVCASTLLVVLAVLTGYPWISILFTIITAVILYRFHLKTFVLFEARDVN